MRTIKNALAILVPTTILNFKMATKNAGFLLISVSETQETWFWSLYPYFKGQGIQWEQQ